METIDLRNIEEKSLKLWKKLIKSIAPPPDLTVSEWADTYRKLSREASAEPGQWRTDRAPYQREILDAITDSKTESIVVMSSAQVGKTELLLNAIGYHIDYDPAPMMLVQPTDTMAETFSKDRLSPMIRDCPKLSDKVQEAKSRNSGNTILHKSFNGGHITMIGANAPSQLASRPIRIVLFDEVDRFPVSAGSEGDPVLLATKRTNTFWNRKIFSVSTPTIKGASRIEDEYESSTMEQWHLPCPHCGDYHTLEWDRVKYNTNNDELISVDGMVCPSCGAIGSEHEWKRGLLKGKWIAKYPDRFKKRGFHLNELTSPWKTWGEIVEDYLKAKDKNEKLKTWWNTSLGLPWEEFGELDMDELLARRREMYNLKEKDVPKDVLVLTAGVDVQDNRLEYEIVGWGLEKETWGVRYGVIMGDPGQSFVWDSLTMILEKTYIRIDGLELKIMTTCIDSGGHYTTETYEYCKKHVDKRVWAIKGKGGNGIPFIQRPKKKNAAGVWLFNIGVDVGKDTITSRLKVQSPGKPGFCHFPMEINKGYDEAYFEGLTSERRVISYRKGRTVIGWVKKTTSSRNEPFDLRNYATAALEILNPPLDVLYKQLNCDENIVKNEHKVIKSKEQNKKLRRGNVSRGIDL
ncbi:phage terminase large subunit family protein [Clostridium intestinale]|uniref:phage terminase large subunit family protein n=1 Tax=Clostridium intestinale TaxID=36845 RepID=UPI002DD6395D|nr:phage terminase large subunit family protein [Clostridium intestinale]WRY53939.1 phage terminase large subunit family protein [Clostridium intestinale]